MPAAPNASSLNNDTIRRLERLRSLEPRDFDLWKYHEDRADRLGERMWSVGIWLITVMNATLSIPFIGGLINTPLAFPYINVANPPGVAFFAVLGASFCAYSYISMRDIREHIESNWGKAGYILEGTWQAEWGGRKSHGWNVMLAVGGLALAAHASLLLLALLSAAS